MLLEVTNARSRSPKVRNNLGGTLTYVKLHVTIKPTSTK